jgi:hypothetical protein
MTNGQNDDAENNLQASTGLQATPSGRTVLPSVVEQVLGSLGGQAFHNYKGDNLSVWRFVSICTGPDVLGGKDAVGQEIALTYFYCHRVQVMKNDGGEYVDAVRCVLMEEDGKAYGFVSDGVATDLARIIEAFGMGPYKEPIKIKVVQGETRRGNRFYSLQPV